MFAALPAMAVRDWPEKLSVDLVPYAPASAGPFQHLRKIVDPRPPYYYGFASAPEPPARNYWTTSDGGDSDEMRSPPDAATRGLSTSRAAIELLIFGASALSGLVVPRGGFIDTGLGENPCRLCDMPS